MDVVLLLAVIFVLGGLVLVSDLTWSGSSQLRSKPVPLLLLLLLLVVITAVAAAFFVEFLEECSSIIVDAVVEEEEAPPKMSVLECFSTINAFCSSACILFSICFFPNLLAAMMLAQAGPACDETSSPLPVPVSSSSSEESTSSSEESSSFTIVLSSLRCGLIFSAYSAITCCVICVRPTPFCIALPNDDILVVLI